MAVLDDREDVPAADVPGEGRREVGRSRLGEHVAAGRRAAHPVGKRPADAGDGQEGREPGPHLLVVPGGLEDPGDLVGGDAVELREPGAVGDPYARERHTGGGELVGNERGAGLRRAGGFRQRAELLEQELGDEVVAGPVHPAQDRAQRGRVDRRERDAVAVVDADPRAAGDRDAGSRERAAEAQRRRERGVARDPPAVDVAVDGQSRERR